MTVVITGSSGFLGNSLVKVFSEKNVKVICLVRKESVLIDSDEIILIRYDNKLCAPDVVQKLIEFKPDVFIHCAWKGTFGNERNETYQLTENIPLTIDSVLLANAIGCKQWIGTGSQAEYGIKDHPIFETDDCDPQTFYGKAKLISGILALELCRQLNIKGIWNRIFSLYGPGDNANYFIPYIVNSLKNNIKPELTNCEQLWDYLFIEDTAKAFYRQIESNCEGLYNVCSGETLVLKNIVLAIQCLVNNNSSVNFGAIPYSDNQIMILSGNSDKLKNETGWRPETNFSEGLKQTVNYFLKNK
jgi:UDP-glucose 4-epimerase